MKYQKNFDEIIEKFDIKKMYLIVKYKREEEFLFKNVEKSYDPIYGLFNDYVKLHKHYLKLTKCDLIIFHMYILYLYAYSEITISDFIRKIKYFHEKPGSIEDLIENNMAYLCWYEPEKGRLNFAKVKEFLLKFQKYCLHQELNMFSDRSRWPMLADNSIKILPWKNMTKKLSFGDIKITFNSI